MKLTRRLEFWAVTWPALLVCFVAMGYRAHTGGILDVDVTVTRFVQDAPDPVARLFSFLNWLGGPAISICAAWLAIVLLLRRHRAEAVIVALTFVPRFFNDYIKSTVGEPRPDASLVYVGYPHDNLSFPSGHVLAITLVFALAFVFAPKLSDIRAVVWAIRIVSGVFVLNVWLARIWLGAHWPTDTLAGYIYASLFLIPALLWLERRTSRTAE